MYKIYLKFLLVFSFSFIYLNCQCVASNGLDSEVQVNNNSKRKNFFEERFIQKKNKTVSETAYQKEEMNSLLILANACEIEKKLDGNNFFYNVDNNKNNDLNINNNFFINVNVLFNKENVENINGIPLKRKYISWKENGPYMTLLKTWIEKKNMTKEKWCENDATKLYKFFSQKFKEGKIEKLPSKVAIRDTARRTLGLKKK